MKKALFIFALLLMLASCSPQARLGRLVRQHPELSKADTLYLCDTVFIPGIRYDTAFSYQFDTIRIIRDRLQIELIKTRDTIYLTAQVQADTIVRIDTLIVDKLQLVKPDLRALALKRAPWLAALGITALAFLAFVMLRYFPKKNDPCIKVKFDPTDNLNNKP